MSTAPVSFLISSLPSAWFAYQAKFPGGKLNTNQDLGVKVATPVGTLVGQLFFGWLADVVGRKRMCECLHSGCRFRLFLLTDDPSY